MAAVDSLLRSDARKGRVRPAPHGRLPPKARISGSLQPIGDTGSTRNTMEARLKEICPENAGMTFWSARSSISPTKSGLARFRANFLYNHWGQAAVFRQIPAKILSFDDLKLPEALKKLCHLDQGSRGRHGTDRLRQVDNARGDDRLHQHESRTAYHHDRRPDRVRPSGARNRVIVHREVGEHTADIRRSAQRGDAPRSRHRTAR